MRFGPQPRPAFGLRPWFAFERRARSFRFFAFAIVGDRLSAGGGYRRVSLVAKAGGDFKLDGTAVATGHRARRRGLRAPGVSSVAMAVRSVHTFGMDRPIRIVDVTREGVVLDSRVVRPGRIVWIRGGSVLETDADVPAPAVGSVLVGVPSSCHARNARHLRHTDRQPRRRQ